jgi:hypothetical protein
MGVGNRGNRGNYIMSKLEAMLCTKKAAAKICGMYIDDIKSVKLNGESVIVSTGEIFVIEKKQQFMDEFIRSRRRSADGLIAVQDNFHTNIFHVGSSSGNEPYKNIFTRYGVTCNCPDYANQLEAFNGDGSCKHIYASLNSIGFDSLKEYREVMLKNGDLMAAIKANANRRKEALV